MVGVHTAFVSGVTTRSAVGNYTARLEIGVSVFFVISGFLLYRPFAVAHMANREQTPLRSFWMRRLKRIVPAYWLAFIVISYVMHADTVRHGWASLAVYLGFAQIYFPHYAITGITQAWSLCTEMTFYLTLPLWSLAVARVARRRTTSPTPNRMLAVELGGLGLLVISSFMYRGILLHAPGQMAGAMLDWLPAFTDLFALGMLLAVCSAWLAAQDRRPAVLWHPALPWVSWLAAAGCFAAVSNIGLPRAPLGPESPGLAVAKQSLYGLFALFAVVPAVFGPQGRGPVRRVLQASPVAGLGVVSYGVYLWHQAWIDEILRWTGRPIFGIGLLELAVPVVGLAVLTASASYLLVERPVRRLGWPVTVKRSGPGARADTRPAARAGAAPALVLEP